MSDDEEEGGAANPCVDWIVARIGDTRPTSFKMAEVGKMKIDENSQCEPPPCMRPHNCREPAETLTRAAAQVRADRLRGRRGREARADLLGPEEQRPHRRPECAGHVRAPFVIPRDRFFPGAEKGGCPFARWPLSPPVAVSRNPVCHPRAGTRRTQSRCGSSRRRGASWSRWMT